MNAALRRCSAALLILPVMVLLAGCIKLDSAMSISSDDKIDATILIAVQKQFGAMAREACNPKSNTSMPNATITDYKDDDYVGCTMRASGLPMNELAKSGSSWNFSHKDGQYTFVMANTNGNSNTGGPQMSGKMFTEFKLAVTFPGDVTSHNGSSTVEGTTVTWTDPDDMFTGKGLKATSKEATPVQAAMPLILGGAGLLVAIGIAFLIVAALRRNRATRYVEAPSQAGTFALHYPPGYFGPEPTRGASASPTWPFKSPPSSGGSGMEPSGTRDGSPES